MTEYLDFKIYYEDKTDTLWLMKITKEEIKRHDGDIIFHRYFSGVGYLLKKINTMNYMPDPDIRKNIINVKEKHLKNLNDRIINFDDLIKKLQNKVKLS